MPDHKTESAEPAEEESRTERREAATSETAKTSADSSGEPSENAETRAEVSELDRAKAEAADMKSRYLRSVADLENFRKRIAREKQEIIRSAAAGVIESMLPILDNMKLGLQAAENHPEAKDVVTGFKMVEDQLRRTLSEHGLEELVPDGESFDPNLHECISHQPSEEVPEDRVIQTVRAGYRLNERLIRAASVIVSSGAADAEKGGKEN